MKLHLPKLLRHAVLACITAVVGISTTVGTAAISGGVVAFAFVSAQAEEALPVYTASLQKEVAEEGQEAGYKDATLLHNYDFTFGETIVDFNGFAGASSVDKIMKLDADTLPGGEDVVARVQFTNFAAAGFDVAADSKVAGIGYDGSSRTFRIGKNGVNSASTFNRSFSITSNAGTILLGTQTWAIADGCSLTLGDKVTVESGADVTVNGHLIVVDTITNSGTLTLNGELGVTDAFAKEKALYSDTFSSDAASLSASADGNGYKYGTDYLLVAGGNVVLGEDFSYEAAASYAVVDGVGLVATMDNAEVDASTYYVNNGTVTFAEDMVTDTLREIRLAEGTTLNVTLNQQNLNNTKVVVEGDAAISLNSGNKTIGNIVCENATLTLNGRSDRYLVVNNSTFRNSTLVVSNKGVQLKGSCSGLNVVLNGSDAANYFLANGAVELQNVTLIGGVKELCSSGGNITVKGTVRGDNDLKKTGNKVLQFDGNVHLAGSYISNNDNGTTQVNGIMTLGGTLQMAHGTVKLGNAGAIVAANLANLNSSTALSDITTNGLQSQEYTFVTGTVANLKKAADNTRLDKVHFGGEQYDLTEDGKFTIANVYYAVEAGSTVTIGGNGATEGTADAKAYVMANGATIRIAAERGQRDTADRLREITGSGNVILGTSAHVFANEAWYFNGALTVESGITIYLGENNGGRRSFSAPNLTSLKLSGGAGTGANLVSQFMDVTFAKVESVADGSVIKLHDLNDAAFNGGDAFTVNELVVDGTLAIWSDLKYRANIGSLSGAADLTIKGRQAEANENAALLVEIGSLGGFSGNLILADNNNKCEVSAALNAGDTYDASGLSIGVNSSLTLAGEGTYSLESSIVNNGMLTFGSDLQLDLTGMTATDGAGGTKVITLLTGAGTSNLASLTDSVLTAATKALGTNWTFNADGTISYMIGSTVSNLYWESGAGNWGDAKWSTTDNATSGQTTLPSSGTVNVVFNNIETASISIGSGASVNNMSVTAGTYTFTGDEAATLEVAGTLTVGSGATANIKTAVEVGSISVAGTLGISQSIKVAENGTVTLDAAGTINLQDFEPTTSTSSYADSVNAFGTTINTYKVFEGGSISGAIGTWQIDGTPTTAGTFNANTGEYTIAAEGEIYGVGTGTVNSSSVTGAEGFALNGGELVLDAAPTEAGFITATDKGGTLDLNGKIVAQSALGVLAGATVLEGNDDSIYDLGADKALASNLSLSGTDWEGTVKMGDIATPTEDLVINSLGCTGSSIEMGAVSVKKLTSSSAAAVQAAALTLGAASEVRGNLTLTSDTLTLGSADASLTTASLTTTSGDLTIAAVSQDVLDALNIKASQGAVTILTLTDDFAGNLTQNEIVVPTRAAAPVEKYINELQWNADKTQLSYTSRVNPDYVGARVEASTQNGLAGVALLQQALQQVNPQVTAPDSALAAVLNAVDAGELSEERAAAVAGAATAVLGMAAHGDLDRQLQAIRNRTTIMGVDQSVVNHDMPYFNAWINAEGDHSELSDDGTEGGYKLNSWGGTVGFDVDIAPTFTAGMALTAMYGDLSVTGADEASGDLNTYYVSAFARYCASAWTHTFVATAGLSDITLNRTVMGEEIEGETDGVSFGLMYEVGRVFALDEDGTACLQPIFNVAFRHTTVNGYDEKGSDLALKVDSQTLNTVTFGLGARMQAIVGESMYNRTSIFECRLLAKFDAGDRSSTSETGLLALKGTKAETESVERGGFGLEAGAGLTIPMGDEGGSLFMDASVELRADYVNVNGTVGYRINF